MWGPSDKVESDHWHRHCCFIPVFHTDVDSAVYTVLTQETDAGRSVRLGLEEVQATHSHRVCFGGCFLGSST